MISHHNVISNVVQIKTFEQPTRDARSKEDQTEISLGLLPLSHIYGLVVIAQASSYRGDGCIILPKFELQSFLNAIQTQKIRTLYLVSNLGVRLCLYTHTNCYAGSSDHHPDGKKQSSLFKIRSQQCQVNLHWSGTPGRRDSRRTAEAVPILEDPTGLWYVPFH